MFVKLYKTKYKANKNTDPDFVFCAGGETTVIDTKLVINETDIHTILTTSPVEYKGVTYYRINVSNSINDSDCINAEGVKLLLGNKLYEACVTDE